MSQKQVKRIRRKFKEITESEIPLIIDNAKKELDYDEASIERWLCLVVRARMSLPEKNIQDFLPKNFINIFRSLMLKAGHKPYSGKIFEMDEFLSSVLEFSNEFSNENRNNISENKTDITEEDLEILSFQAPDLVNLFRATRKIAEDLKIDLKNI
ncbi:hypothetical protein [Fluviispira sanaruensis]|uniref:Uncharacterized protein n=1 Tax=Fluviispira sanaruensis TaxID=2493639 RepID=A0A4P2VQK8_FLUSA|nr:hypothetical protein [Fluviispira sanaruensis]BBH54700.1 hypothetical protein JCM31447_31740 [Fluviispira sanaruensis]